MSLQFIFGNSGSGKSDFLYDSVLKQAKENKEQQFLIIVPEQFTMQTQRELVERQKQHAIMNVDVLSFARLAYRVFDDLGKQNVVVLEETGKNLVLRKVAEQKKAELKVLGANMNKMGYVGEVKSLISALMQYNVRPDALAEFLEKEPLGEGLRLKMQDVLTMYQGFTEYLKGRYITAEEVLELLYDVAEESELLRNSVSKNSASASGRTLYCISSEIRDFTSPTYPILFIFATGREAKTACNHERGCAQFCKTRIPCLR